MVYLDVIYNLETLQGLVEERNRVVEILGLEPSQRDDLGLKKQINKCIEVLQEPFDNSESLIQRYNTLVDQIAGNEDWSEFKFTKDMQKPVEVEAHAGNNSVEMSESTKKKVRFEDHDSGTVGQKMRQEQVFEPYHDEPASENRPYDPTSIVANRELFIQQQQELQQQDHHLEALGSSVHRTHEMSVNIHEEVSYQNEHVLQDLENMVDSSHRHLGRANRSLGIYERAARENGPCLIIVVLILILLILIVI